MSRTQWHKAKKSKGVRHTERLRTLKTEIQKGNRKAYWNYIETLITPETDRDNYRSMKKIWTYVRRSRQDNNGVACLIIIIIIINFI